MRPDKRTRQAALLADPQALALWAERKRAREVQAIVKSNQGAKHERLDWKRDKSFDTNHVKSLTPFYTVRVMWNEKGKSGQAASTGGYDSKNRNLEYLALKGRAIARCPLAK
jgi:hypothetical protein